MKIITLKIPFKCFNTNKIHKKIPKVIVYVLIGVNFPIHPSLGRTTPQNIAQLLMQSTERGLLNISFFQSVVWD